MAVTIAGFEKELELAKKLLARIDEDLDLALDFLHRNPVLEDWGIAVEEKLGALLMAQEHVQDVLNDIGEVEQ